MSESVFSRFISTETERIHREHLKTLKHRYSILVKSVSALNGVDAQTIERVRLAPDVRRDACMLLSDIRLHELYFTSFTELAPPSPTVRSAYGSESAFLYEIFEAARHAEGKFLCIGCTRRGISIFTADKYTSPSLLSDAVLALDTAEHSYFLDYGFDIEAYVRRALPYLNLGNILLDKKGKIS